MKIPPFPSNFVTTFSLRACVGEGRRICFLDVHASGGPMKGRALLARLCVLLAIVEVARSLADSLVVLHPHPCMAASFHRTSGVKMRELPPSARNFVDMSSSDFRRPYTGRSNSAAPSQGSMRATPGSFGMGATGNIGSSLDRGPPMGVVVPSNGGGGRGRPRNFVSPVDEVRAIARAAARAADAATNSRAAASVASEGELARSTMPLPPGASLPQTMFGGFDATARAAARGASGFPVGPPQGVAAAEDLSSSSGGYDSYAERLAVRRAAQEAAMNPLQRAANAFTKPFRLLSKPSVYTPGFGAGYDGMGPDVPLAAAGGAFRAGQPAGVWEAAWGGGTTPVRKKSAPELLFSSANVPGWPAPSTYLGYRPGGGGGGGGAVKTALAATLAVGVIALGPQATFDVLKTEVAPPARGGIEAVGKGVEIISKVVTVPAEVIVRKSGVVEGVTSWANRLRADSWAQLQPETRDSLEQRQATLAEAGRVVGRGTIDAEVVSLRTAKDLAQGAATLAKEVATVVGEALLETSQLLGEKLQEVTGFELGGGEAADEEEVDGEEAEEEEAEEVGEEAEEAEATMARPGLAAEGIDAAAEEMALLKQEVAALKAKAEVFAAAAEQAEQAAAKASAEAATASAEAMRLAAEKEALAALKAEAEQAAAKASAEAAAASAEAMRLAAEKAEMEQAAAERAMEQAAAERARATQLEAEQLAQRAEEVQLAAERAEAEAERAAAERAEAEAERFALERREAGRAAAKRAAAQRLEWDQIVTEAAEARASAQAAEAKAAEAARAAQAAADEALEAKRAAAATPSAAEWEPPRGAGRSPRGANGRAPEYDANARAAARAKARASAARPAERVPIQLPDGVIPSQQYRATLDDGSEVMFTAPADARAGQVIELELMPASARSRAR